MSRRPLARSPARGFTIVEMMVAIAISLVVVLGFSVIFVNMKTTFIHRNALADLQDNERLAMSLLTEAVQEAGYYPDTRPPSLTRTQELPALAGNTVDATYGHLAAGQYVVGQVGTPSGSASSDTLTVAYATQDGSLPGGSVLTCQGGSNVTGANVTVRSVFYVDTTKNALGCIVVATDVATQNDVPAMSNANVFAPLVTNVNRMTVLYGVDTNGDGAVDQYLDAAATNTGGYWGVVKNVRVTLYFIDPNNTANSIPWTQTIPLMNNR